jgi:Glycosyl hydrolase family 79 C-terminal beta domain
VPGAQRRPRRLARLPPPVRRGCGALAAAVAVAGLSAGSAQASVATVTVGGAPVTRPLPSSFVGLAFTYSALARWLSPTGPVDPALVGLIRGLTPSGRPSLRIGGESADRSWWPIKGYRKPIGITYDLGPAWTVRARRFARATDARLLLGLELEADRPRIDAVEARELLRRIGGRYIQSFQIGNEPNLYAVIPWYRVLNGHPVVWYSKLGTPVYARSGSYGPSQFDSQIAAIMRVIPSYPIAGPETNGPTWTQALIRFLKPSGRVTTLTTHAYGVNNCNKDRSSDLYPTVPNLLGLSASRDLLTGMAPYVSLVHRRGGSYRIDELGAVACTGSPGVSNSMATALWTVDALFDAARQGINGVNLHTDYARINNLFSLRFRHGRWRATVRPIYYGALLFADADPVASRLLNVQGGTMDTLRVWASRGRDHRVRITLINDSLDGAATVRLRLPAGVRSANGTIERLQAPGGAYATHGVTLGGRSFGTTTSGVLAEPQLGVVSARRGALTVQLRKGSAALVTLGRG